MRGAPRLFLSLVASSAAAGLQPGIGDASADEADASSGTPLLRPQLLTEWWSKIVGGPPAPPLEALEDRSALCFQWADAGECASNPSYMMRWCSLSCSRYVTSPPAPVLQQILDTSWTALGSVATPVQERPQDLNGGSVASSDAVPDESCKQGAAEHAETGSVGGSSSSESLNNSRSNNGSTGSNGSAPPLAAAVVAAVSRAQVDRQRRVREAFVHAWSGYTKYARRADGLPDGLLDDLPEDLPDGL